MASPAAGGSDTDSMNRIHCFRPIMLLALVCSFAAFGESDTPPAPACEAPQYRQFDFWLGDFEVLDADGRRAGHNHIESTQAGCLIVERWQGAEGGTGQSYNFYDPGRKRWRQLWVSTGAVIEIEGGLTAEPDGRSSMLLNGEIRYRRDGRVAPFRGRWTPMDKGIVRQFFEEQQADGNWAAWFEGFYHPNSDTEDTDP